MQVIGGGVETMFPTNEEVEALGLKPRMGVPVTVRFIECGTGSESREVGDKTYTDRFTTYKMKCYLPRPDEVMNDKKKVA